MSLSALMKEFQLVRGSTLHSLGNVNEEVIHTVPDGFSNNILWNVGHILLSAEQLLLRGANESGKLPNQYKGWFGGGTKPADWNGEVPSWHSLVSGLKEQQDWVVTEFGSRLDEKLATPFQIREVEFTTYGDVLSFVMFHEGLHLGQINAMNRLLSASR
jgi:uncharacterized damage-inducible protein DinB